MLSDLIKNFLSPPRTQTCPHTRAAGLRPWKSHSKPLGTYTDSACPKQWGPGLTRCPGGPHYAFWCHSEITRLPSTHPPSIPALCSAFLVWTHYISTSSLKPQSSLTDPGCPLVQIHFPPILKIRTLHPLHLHPIPGGDIQCFTHRQTSSAVPI